MKKADDRFAIFAAFFRALRDQKLLSPSAQRIRKGR